MQVTYRELIELAQGLNRLTTKGVSLEGMQQVMNLNDEIEEQFKLVQPDYRQKFENLMAEHDIKQEDNAYSWEGHEHQDSITSAVNSLLDEVKAELKETNKVKEKDVLAMTNGLTIGEVKAFKKYLSK